MPGVWQELCFLVVPLDDALAKARRVVSPYDHGPHGSQVPPPKEDSNVMKPPYKSQLFNSAVASPFLNYHENTKDLKQ